jgi:hypothetical protein
VDDNSEPLKELRRLVVLQRAYNHMNAGDLAVERKDNQGALREYSAAAALAPGNMEMVYWHAVALVNMGTSRRVAAPFQHGVQGREELDDADAEARSGWSAAEGSERDRSGSEGGRELTLAEWPQ